ncbi:uncharacterized protein [Anabrus simplex]|uniref:uncharacterized protein isoform X2 n=1 Tax=Anabrus simplex TaxID=316456 RepID=UPI0035A26725
MEQPVYIKCEPGCVSGTGKLNNADRDMKLPTDEQMDMKTEPEDVFYEPFIKGELGIQDIDVKLPTDELMDMKTEPEDVFYEPFIKEELEIHVK